MRRKVVYGVVLGVLLTLISATTALATPAGPVELASSGNKPITKSGHEVIRLSAAECAKAKANYPSKVNDPSICQVEHGWTVTITTDSATNVATGVAPAVVAGCPSGTAHFHDWQISLGRFWQYDMDTGFRWNGDCRYPTLTGQSCYPEWAVNTTFNDVACYSYYYIASNWTSTAAVNSIYPCTSIGGQTICANESQCREC
jgi:hypothetical protein